MIDRCWWCDEPAIGRARLIEADGVLWHRHCRAAYVAVWSQVRPRKQAAPKKKAPPRIREKDDGHTDTK
jgi:hypothetical protein